MAMRRTTYSNQNHRRAYAPVRCCSTCGEVVNEASRRDFATTESMRSSDADATSTARFAEINSSRIGYRGSGLASTRSIGLWLTRQGYPQVHGRIASSLDDPPGPTSFTERHRPLEVLRVVRNDIEMPAILEMNGKGLAFDHGGCQIEVEETAPGLLKSLQLGIWIILSSDIDDGLQHVDLLIGLAEPFSVLLEDDPTPG